MAKRIFIILKVVLISIFLVINFVNADECSDPSLLTGTCKCLPQTPIEGGCSFPGVYSMDCPDDIEGKPCDSDLNTCTVGENPHRECDGASCIWVLSCGENSCTDNSDCTGVPPSPTGPYTVTPADGEHHTCSGLCAPNRCIRGVDDGNNVKLCNEDFRFEENQTDDYCHCTSEGFRKITRSDGEDHTCAALCEPKECILQVDDGNVETCNGTIRFEEGQDDDYCICAAGGSEGDGDGGGATIEIDNPLTVDTFDELVNKIIDFVFWIAVAIAPLMIIFAGFHFITAAGDPKKLATAKNIMIYTAIGLAIVFLAKGLIAVLQQVIGVDKVE